MNQVHVLVFWLDEWNATCSWILKWNCGRVVRGRRQIIRSQEPRKSCRLPSMEQRNGRSSALCHWPLQWGNRLLPLMLSTESWNLLVWDHSATFYFLFLLQTVIVWDSESKRIVEEKKHHERGLREICWIADDSLASCSLDHTVVIHRIGTDEYEIFTHQVKLVELTTIQLINRNHKKIRNLNRIVCLGQSQCASMEQHVQAAGLLFQWSNCESKWRNFFFNWNESERINLQIWKPGNPTAVMELVEAHYPIGCLDWHQTGSCSSLLAW